MKMTLPPKMIIRRFFPCTDDVKITMPSQGNINDTFLLSYRGEQIILQRISASVFAKPQLLISNLEQLSRHLRSQEKCCDRRWEEAVLVPATDGATSIVDNNGRIWRALSYISDSISLPRARTLNHAKETGWALGRFHKRVAGLAIEKMHTPLPGFHILSSYITEYQRIAEKTSLNTSSTVQWCRTLIAQRQETALSLERARDTGATALSVVHGDPKIGNVLFDNSSRLALGIIDLDTVGPGLRIHDIGDCLRSVCNRGGENGIPEQARFDLDRCKAALQGYFLEAGRLLSPIEKELIYDGVTAITFELGLRFFIDYLQGGIYFKCSSPEETLRKAVVQFALFTDIMEKKEAIRAVTLQTAQET